MACCRAPEGACEEPRAGVGNVSGSGRAVAAAGWHAVRRRAADARNRALFDGSAATHHVRRTVARTCAEYCSRCAEHNPRTQSRGDHLSAGRAERGAVAQARKPRLCAGKRACDAVRDWRGTIGR